MLTVALQVERLTIWEDGRCVVHAAEAALCDVDDYKRVARGSNGRPTLPEQLNKVIEMNAAANLS